MIKIRTDDFSKLEYEGWQRVADKYLDCWANLTQLFITPLLNAVRVKEGMKVLDIACGPGIVSKKIRERKALAIGIDFSPEMIQLAKTTLPGIEFFEADAQQLPFDESSFDAVVMNFGLLHLPEPLQAMKEAYRVVRKNGWFAFTVWAGPSRNPASKVMNDAKEKFADMNVPMPAAPPYNYFENKENCNDFLKQAGFDPQTMLYETELATWVVPTADFLFEAELNGGVRNAAFLRQQKPEVLQKIKEASAEGIQKFKVKDGYGLPFMACIIAAQKI
jgi:ubiquinone/menaquinone biosynthesis C-methylase UbiE